MTIQLLLDVNISKLYDWNACGTSKIVILLSMICRIRERDKKKTQHNSTYSVEEEFDIVVENQILKDE